MIHSISGRQKMCSECGEVFHFSIKHVCAQPAMKETLVEKIKKVVKKVSKKTK